MRTYGSFACLILILPDGLNTIALSSWWYKIKLGLFDSSIRSFCEYQEDIQKPFYVLFLCSCWMMIKAARKMCGWKGCFFIKVIFGRLGKRKTCIIITQNIVTVKYREASSRENKKLTFLHLCSQMLPETITQQGKYSLKGSRDKMQWYMNGTLTLNKITTLLSR